MALITCPDCEKEVSAAAPACPHCGRPMAAMVIEKTDKSFKGGMLIGIVIAVLGFFSAAWIGGPAGLTVMGCGVLLFLWSFIGAWWNHG